VARAGAQGLEPESVQQVVNRLQAADHAEFVLQDPAHVFTAQGAHPVGVSRTGSESVSELLLLIVGQGLLAPAPGSIGQCIGSAGVVPRDPSAHLARGQEHPLGDIGRGVAEQGQADGAEPARDACPWLGADEFGQFVDGVVRFDLHGGLQPGYHQPTHHTDRTQLIHGIRIIRIAEAHARVQSETWRGAQFNRYQCE
jgi:hypothetical protein